MDEMITVAIDGPAGAGKSSVARAVAQRLGFVLVDTGAIYRAVAWAAQEASVDLQNDEELSRVVSDLGIHFEMTDAGNRVFVQGVDVSEAIRTPAMSMAASSVSARKVVRDGLLDLQRQMAALNNAVLEGRDIGTVVCPAAQVKFFLDASVTQRAKRRWKELRDKGGKVPSLESVHNELEQRDAQDRNRQHAPLIAADDAQRIDSTQMNLDEVIECVIQAVEQARGLTV
jgi:CMP/dCMP kinase